MEKLSRKVKIGFGIGDLGGNLYFTIIGFYLLFYLTDVVRIPASLAGIVLMVGKIWDAVTDPVTGYLSDMTRTKWGRRRPYILAGAILCFIGMFFMFLKPGTTQTSSLFALTMFYFCFLSLAYTIVNIPYSALVPELTPDFDQRTILNGYRMSFAVVGTFIGAGAVLPIVHIFSSERTGWAVMGLVMGFIILVTALITFFTVREPAAPAGGKGVGFLRTYRETLGLKVFLLALFPWALFITGVSVVQGSLLYYFKYIYHNEGLFQIALLFLLFTSLICIPFWVWLSRRIGKNSCYMLGMGIMTVGVMVFAFLGGEGRVAFAFIVMAASGAGLSTHYVMPHSILPDVVEYDFIKSGIRREGAFASLWTFSSKIGQALALSLSGFLLDLFRYMPDTVPEPVTVLGIRIICGPVPAVFFIIGIIILSFYPISRKFYDRMMETGKIPDQG